MELMNTYGITTSMRRSGIGFVSILSRKRTFRGSRGEYRGVFTVGSTAVVGWLVAEQAQDLALQRREIRHEDHWFFAADARSVL